MIYGNDNYKDIQGIEKIFNINPNFKWNDIRYIDKMEYNLDLNEYAERVSNLKIHFLIELPNKKMCKLCIEFNEINNLKLNNIGGKYNQVMGFEIINQSMLGWEQEQYTVRDYENGIIEFNCKNIKII